jgi:cytochrome P450
VGQPLARLEATIAFAALAERAPELRRAGRMVPRNAATIRGPLRLPVAVGKTTQRPRPAGTAA